MTEETMELQQADESANALKEAVGAVIAKVRELDVVDTASNEQMAGLVGEIATWEKKGKDEELSFTRPLNNVIKNIRARYKPQLDMLATAKAEGKAKQRKYYLAEQEKARQAELKRQEEERKAREEEERRLKEAEELLNQGKDEEAEKIIDEWKEPEAAPAAPKPETMTKSASGHASIARKIKKFRVVDEKKVPRRFLEINHGLIRKAVNAGEEFSPDIHGIEVYEDIDVATRTAR